MALVLNLTSLRLTTANLYGQPDKNLAVNISAGAGITLTPNPITGTGTVAVTNPFTPPLTVAQGGTGAITFGSAGYIKTPSGVGAFTVQAVPIPVLDGGTGSSFTWTPGSVFFANGAGNFAENNSTFFYDSTNKRLGIGTATPLGVLHTVGQTALWASNTDNSGTAQTLINMVTGSGSSSSLLVTTFGPSFVTSGLNKANESLISASSSPGVSGSLSLASTDAAGTIEFYTGGFSATTNLMGTISSNALGSGKWNFVAPIATKFQAATLINGLNSNVTTLNSSYLRITGPSAAFSIGGFQFPSDGTRLTVYNTTSQTLTIVNEDAVTPAANRIKTLTGANVVLGGGIPDAIEFIYDLVDARWILRDPGVNGGFVKVDGTVPLTAAWNAGNFAITSQNSEDCFQAAEYGVVANGSLTDSTVGTDQSANYIAAMLAAVTAGKKLKLPSGVIKFTANTPLPEPFGTTTNVHINIEGAGNPAALGPVAANAAQAGGTILKYWTSVGVHGMSLTAANNIPVITLKNLEIQGPDFESTVSTNGVTVTWNAGPKFDSLQIGDTLTITGVAYTVAGTGSTTITLGASAGVQPGVALYSTKSGDGFHLVDASNRTRLAFSNVDANHWRGGKGFYLDGPENSGCVNVSASYCDVGLSLRNAANANQFFNTTIQLCATRGLELIGSSTAGQLTSGNSFFGGLIQSNVKTGIFLTGTIANSFIGVWCEQNNSSNTAGSYGVHVFSNSATTFNTNNQFKNVMFNQVSANDIFQVEATGAGACSFTVADAVRFNATGPSVVGAGCVGTRFISLNGTLTDSGVGTAVYNNNPQSGADQLAQPVVFGSSTLAPNTGISADFVGNVAYRSGTALTFANGANDNVTLPTGNMFSIIGPSGAFTFSGFTGTPGVNGREITLTSNVAQAWTVKHNSVSSQKIFCPGGADLVMTAGNSSWMSITMRYSSGSGAWFITGRSN